MASKHIIDSITMTLEQQKAFKSLQRAIKKCEKLNVLFYQILDITYGLNGDTINRIHDNEDFPGGCTCHSENALWDVANYAPFITTECSWADDLHFVQLKEKG